MAGLSLGDLADRLGGVVTRQALYKYERGQMMPSARVLDLLVKALDLGRFEPFLEEATYDADLQIKRSTGRAYLISPVLRAKSEGSADIESAIRQIRFREREKLPAKTASSLKLSVADYIGRCREIEGALGMGVAFENPVAGRAVRTPADVERAASDVRRAWRLGAGPLTNLLSVLEEKGVRVFEVRDIEGFEGLSGRYEGEPFIVVNRDFPTDRVRFTAAHELGHILCGFPERRSAESLCHTFAAAFLLPREAAERALMPKRRKVALWELKEIKESYGISLQAAMYRALGLGIVGGRQLRNFRETFRANGWLEREPVAYGGMERTSRLKRLVGYAAAEGIIGPERAAALLRLTGSGLRGELGDFF